MTAPTVVTVTVETQAQNLILTELQNVYQRLARQLEAIEREAAKSRSYPSLDTLFLLGKTRDLPEVVATYEAVRSAAKWAGCTADAIRTVCSTGWILIELAEAGRLGRAEKKDTES